MSRLTVQTGALWRAAPIGWAGSLLICLLVGSMTLKAPSAGIGGLAAEVWVLAAICASAVGLHAMLLANLLPTLPANPLLRPALRPWLWRLLWADLLLQGLISGWPLARLMAPASWLAALLVPLALVSASLIWPMWVLLRRPGLQTYSAEGLVLVGFVAVSFPDTGLAVWLAGLSPHTASAAALPILLLSAWGARSVVQRLCDPTAPLRPARAWGQAQGMAGRAAGAVTGTTSQWGWAQLVVPARPQGLRHLILGTLIWAPVVWMMTRHDDPSHAMALLWCLLATWLVASLAAPWNHGLWWSPRSLLLPGCLQRPQLLTQVLRQVLARQLRWPSLWPVLPAMALAWLAGLSAIDGLAMVLMGFSGQAWALTVAILVEGRWRPEGARLLAINVAPLTAMGAVLSVGWRWLDWSLMAGSATAWGGWLLLAWLPAMLALALAVLTNRQRWAQLDAGQQAAAPAWWRQQVAIPQG